MNFPVQLSSDAVSSTSRLLDLSTTYYLRKLLRQHLHHLKSIVASGASIPADDLSDIGAVLTSLYLEPDELADVVEQIDRLVAAHEAMSTQPAQFQTERVQLEEKIFWFLGYKSGAIGRRGNIAIVEPDRHSAKRMVEALMEKGYEVTLSSTADQILNQIRLNVPDVILVAVKLAEMSGFTLCQELKTVPELLNIPVIVLGEFDCIQEKIQAFEAGAIDYLVKPVSLEELFLHITARCQLQDLQNRLALKNQTLQLEVKERAEMEVRLRNMFGNVFERAVIGMFQSSAAGRYLRVNQALARLYDYDSPQSLIQSVNEIEEQIYVEPDRRSEFIAYMGRYHQVTAFEAQVRRRDGSVIWISESVRSVFDESGEFLFYEGSVQDITARKRMEQLLQTQSYTTKILTMSSTVMQASPLILQAVSELLGWHRGELWLLNQTKQMMHKVDRWLAPTPYATSSSMPTPQPMPKGQGFPGLVWSHGEPLWVANLQQIPQLTEDERLRYRGIQSAVGFPLVAGYRTLGVLLFFSANSDELDESLMNMLMTLSRQFAQFIDRRYVDTALRQSEKRLQTATEELADLRAQLEVLQIKVLKSDLTSIAHQLNSH
jgi:PAS domain S-box-containing protein